MSEAKKRSDSIILTLDSSTAKASVSVARGAQVIEQVFITRQKSHSEQMHIAIEKVLLKGQIQLSDITALAVTHGPGSFTGLRVAGNIAKSFCYLLQIPLISISTLEALAHPILMNKTDSKIKVCAMINAFKQMVFLALYQRDPSNQIPIELIKPGVFALDQLEQLIAEPVICVGDAFDYYREEFSPATIQKLLRDQGHSDFPEPQSLIEIAFEKLSSNQTMDWNQFTPLYLKASEAEENLRKGLLHFRKLN